MYDSVAMIVKTQPWSHYDVLDDSTYVSPTEWDGKPFEPSTSIDAKGIGGMGWSVNEESDVVGNNNKKPWVPDQSRTLFT